ncbi:hemolysin family protein [Actibacterium ureilyticum]|uniref:hemolysin family protein n=1 Tax=Actibacterium ureilyticum TaxID=1590614 RepID=UPI000BAAAC51|nr:hemolysin family protein [Actibacterium ureilyticum]
MGEDDGSSSAAQGAQDFSKQMQGGFFHRLFGARRSPVEAIAPQAEPSEPSTELTMPVAMPGLLNLRRMRVEDVAIPKAEIVAVPADIDKDALIGIFSDSGMSRLPVYEGTLDSPVGMLHLKDVALRYGFNGAAAEFSLRELLRPLLYAPPSMPIGVLLQKMQNERVHMALVIDEYGGVDGLVTIEDLIEQVVGEIADEHDVDEGEYWLLERPGSYLVQARAPLDELEPELGLKLADEEDEEEVDTLGGLVFMMIGRVPARGEVIPHESGAEFEIVDADPRRIKRVRVRLPKQET